MGTLLPTRLVSCLKHSCTGFLWLSLFTSLGACDTHIYLPAPSQEDAGDSGALQPPPDYQTSSLLVGEYHGCVVLDGSGYCWGNNEYGQIDPSQSSAYSPMIRMAHSSAWQTLAPAEAHSCGLDVTGSVFCQGDNSRGQLGQGDNTTHQGWQRVALARPAIAIATQYLMSCALLDNAQLYCWGENYEGPMALNDFFPGPDQLSPVLVASGLEVEHFGLGQQHLCLRSREGRLLCSGRNDTGNCGVDPQISIQLRTLTDIGEAQTLLQLSHSQADSCSLNDAGTVQCWGNGSHLAQTETGLSEVEQFIVSDFHRCALLKNGQIQCRGRNIEGQLGLGFQSEAESNYTLFGSGESFRSIALGRFISCALSQDFKVVCTGSNIRGSLGLSDPSLAQSTPREIPFPTETSGAR